MRFQSRGYFVPDGGVVGRELGVPDADVDCEGDGEVGWVEGGG